MTALLTATELRQHLDTDLGDTALDRIAADADREIVRRYGGHTTAEEVHRFSSFQRRLFTDREITSVTTIVESYPGYSDMEDVTLDASDYTIEGKRILRRNSTGTNGQSGWGVVVTVTYVPVDDRDRRKRVTIDLVRLALRYSATQNESLGDYSAAYLDYARERELLLRSLQPTSLGLFA